MSNDNEPATIEELVQANRNLTESLTKCRVLVAECRDKLAATGEASFIPQVANRAKARSD